MTAPPGPGPDRPTVAVYEARADEWAARRRPEGADRAAAVAADAGAGAVVDLGCGPGWHLRSLGPRAVALDAARAMLLLARRQAPEVPGVQADLARLPFRSGSVGGAVGVRSYLHVARPHLPLALADLHRALTIDAPVCVEVLGGDADLAELEHDDFPGRRFAGWSPAALADALTGAGFTGVDLVGGGGAGDRPGWIRAGAVRARSLPDTVGPGMRLLVCGLNPSLYAADRGVGFARSGNRFWPAALAAGLVSRDRDPVHALEAHGLGMTDLVKRATARADALRPEEYADGLARVERLVAWLRPGAVCLVGLAGWRAARDRRADAGPQPAGLGGRPLYVMPSTSGVNGRSSLAQLTDHLRSAAALADGAEGDSVRC